MSPTRRLRLSPLRMLVSLSLILGAVLTAVPAQTLTITPGTVGGFEIDGNEIVNTPGNLDWKNVSPIVVTDDTLDSGFRGDSKELSPASWVCNTGGANPGQGNILRVYANPRATAATTFLDLAWVRENVIGSGEITLEFELNQVASPEPGSFKNTPCPVTRTTGDLLVAFDFSNGTAAPVINLFRWTGTTWDPTVAPVTGSGAVNTAAIAAGDDIAGIGIDATRFGEASVDLTALIGTGPNQLPCSAFTQLNPRSRSSNAIDSALQDRIASIPINLCPNQPQPGHIIVQKNTVPNGATGTFPFVTTGAGYTGFNLSGAGDSHDSGALQPGTYRVAENVPAGWTLLPTTTCNGAPYTPGADLTLAAGQTITCIFTDSQVNPPAPGRIIVQKVTNVASTDLFHFTTTYPPGGFSLANGGSNDSGDLAPNTYTVSEDGLTGWDLTSAVCRNAAGAVVTGPANIALASGQIITCVFTNTQQGTLEVVKSMDPNDPGRFNLAIDGTTLATNVGNGGTTQAQFVSAVGSHTVSEAAGTGTSLSNYISSIQCRNAAQQIVFSGFGTSLAGISVPAGDHVVCTITNTRGRGTLRVIKALLPATDPGRFNLLIDGTTKITDRTDGGTTGFVQVDSGTHSVGETAGTNTDLANYTSAIVCSHLVGRDGAALPVVVASGPGTDLSGVPVGINDDVTCVITNTRGRGTLQVIKALVPPTDPGRFDLLIDGTTQAVGAANGGATPAVGVDAGTHTVAETGNGTNLAAYTSSISCVQRSRNASVVVASGKGTSLAGVPVGIGDAIVCTITNTKHGVYGNDPSVNPVEQPYAPGPNPGGEPAGDTGTNGGTVDQPATDGNPATQVAGTNVTASPVADPSGGGGNPVVNAIETQVNLPRTGAEIVQQAIAGLILLGGGLVLLALRRRRSSSPSA